MARRSTARPSPAWVGDLPVFERTLANGFKALVLPRSHAPVVVCDLYYPVGSVNEPPGKTGLAHFVEHMLFKGTERFPKGRLQLYTGVGLGPVIGHPETRVDNVRSEPGYELAGLGVQGFVGVRFLILKNLGVFTEYKFSHSALEVTVPAGQGRVQETTPHIVGGITIHFGSF